MNDIIFSVDALKEYMDWQIIDKKTIRKINALILDITRNGPLRGTGKPEALKYQEGYSRRIDEYNRLIYIVDEHQNLRIISCKGHYNG